MRISSSTIYNNASYNIAGAMERYYDTQQAVSTGKVLTKPSDSPTGIGQSLSLRNALDSIEQYKSNLNTAKGIIGSTDNALNRAGNVLRQARSLALQGATDAINVNTRAGLAAQVDSLITELEQVANSEYNGRYLFAGQRTNQAPFKGNGPNSFAYQGGSAATGDDKLSIEVSQSDTVVVNTPGDTTFQAAFDTLKVLRQNLADAQTTLISNTDLPNLDSALATITGLRGDVGAKNQRLDQVSVRLDQSKDDFTKRLSNVEDADIPSSIVAMNAAQTAYQAALTGASRGFQQSLLDFLR